MSAGHLILWWRHLGGFGSIGGGIVLASVTVPGIVQVETKARGAAAVESHHRSLCRAQSQERGFAGAEAAPRGLSLGDAAHRGFATGEQRGRSVTAGLSGTRGFAGAESHARSVAKGESSFRGLQSAEHYRLGFPQACLSLGDERMSTPTDFDVTWREDGTATVVARLTARDGSGSATGAKGEGKWVLQANLSTITYRVFDVTDPASIVEITAGAQTVTIASAVIDTPVTDGVLWTLDAIGYNFLHDLPASCFPTGGHTYQVEYKFTFSSTGYVGWGVFRGEAKAVLSG